ncbi:MAG: putative peptidoglycan glycosyltransferase FtsW [Verrucomicrobiota bacterium]
MGRRSAILLCASVASLIVLGLVMLSSTSVWAEEMRGAEDPYLLVKRQLMWLVLGVLGAWFLAMVDYRKVQRYWPWLLGGVCLLLVLCYVPGVREVRHGEGRWINLPGLPVMQPSELAKPIVVFVLASWFASYQAEAKSFLRGYVVPCLILGIPCLLILFERDLGTTMVLGAVGASVLFIAGTRLWYLVFTGLVAVGGGWFFVETDPIRKERITAFMNMDDPEVQMGSGWQLARSLNAFENGGVWGTGLGNGAEKHGSLPFAHTDFIFAALGEELGLVASLGTVTAFVLIAISGMAIAVHAQEFFGKLIAAGVTMVIVVPAALNMGVVTGSLPVTGLPLPFLSYGGSNLVFTLASVGLLLGVYRRAVFVEAAAMPRTKERKFALKL